ncbi:MAG: arsenite methyltransferase [Candidatus Aquicultor sp.]|nr:arsenite methyltransferase [Candidatus Aquicultor sp.]
MLENDDVRKIVREGYAKIAQLEESCCGTAPAPAKSSDGCGCGCGDPQESISKQVGYTDEDINSVPDGANMGLGCGNPVALASLKEGEVVLDLGSGGGFDCFLAAPRVGESGRVIGVDMTPEMLEKARANARKSGFANVEFRLGEIEHLPVADNEVDVIISNCVINLSPDKQRVFDEALRVLKPGGRLMVSDIVLLSELPDFIKDSITGYVSCLCGAVMRDEYLALMEKAGFTGVEVLEETAYPVEKLISGPAIQAIIEDLEITDERLASIAATVLSAKVCAYKK